MAVADRWELLQDSEMQSSSGTRFSNSGLLKAAALGEAETAQLSGDCGPLAVSHPATHRSLQRHLCHFAQQLGTGFWFSQAVLSLP